jgi:predicted PurR-regulated permease PerM
VLIFLLAGLLTSDTLWQALLPAGLYLGFHLIEGETVTPMLLARRFTLNPRHHLARLLVLDVGHSGRDSLCPHARDY